MEALRGKIGEHHGIFTPQHREALRAGLLRRAEAEPTVVAAAVTGSGADGGEDRWSDIDLALAVRDGVELSGVLEQWTSLMYAEHGAAHHMDMLAGPWIYRVFLLANSLQVDLAFVPAAEFRALAPTFRLVFGEAQAARYVPQPAPADLLSYGWLYALHARSSIARGKWWQAEHMIRGVRDQAMALACLRHGVPAVHGKGFDQLPAELLERLQEAAGGRMDRAKITRAFRFVLGALIDELSFLDPARLDPALTERLRVPLEELVSWTRLPMESI